MECKHVILRKTSPLEGELSVVMVGNNNLAASLCSYV